MKTGTIRQSVKIRATPREVYNALTDSKKHSRFTSEKANIAKKAGGKFSCYGGYITGVNIELKPAKLIVQAWRSTGWPAGFYSLVTFKLSKVGRGQTKLEFTHTGVPNNDVKAKSAGWRSHYWTPLKRMLEK